MDPKLTEQLLLSLLRTKGAVAKFLEAHSQLSMGNQEDRLELIRLAEQAAREAKSTRKKPAPVKVRDLNEDRPVATVNDWAKVLHTAKTLALCSLPYEAVKERTMVRKAKLDDGTLVHVRFSAHDEKIELPYGKDRALITWLMTIARGCNSPRVEFESALDFLQVFGLARNGRKYAEFAQAMKRICNVVITYGYASDSLNLDRDRGEKLVYDQSLPHKSDVDSETMGLRTLPGMKENYFIEFGGKTFEDLVANPVSVPLEIMKKYQNSPVSWDFLQFVSYQAAEIMEGDQKAFPLENLVSFLGSNESNIRKVRMRIDSILSESGDYLPHVRLIGRGVSSVLIIHGAKKELSTTSSKDTLVGQLLPPEVPTSVDSKPKPVSPKRSRS